MPEAEPFNDRLLERPRRETISEDAVVNALMQGREYRWRRRKIHVSHPQGQHITALIDVPLRHSVPLRFIGVSKSNGILIFIV